jgi:hypothetical protein
MKSLLYSLFLTAGILLFASATQTQAQLCTWQVCNSIDCDLNIVVFQNCPPNPPQMVAIGVVGPGCWDNPTCEFLLLNPCNLSCTFTVVINGTTYADGDIICCSPSTGPEQCSPCNCAYVRITPSGITLDPARSGPGWNCDDPLR